MSSDKPTTHVKIKTIKMLRRKQFTSQFNLAAVPANRLGGAIILPF